MAILTTKFQIDTFRLCTLKAGLKLEIVGMKKRGKSCYAILKELGFYGTKKQVLEQVELTLSKILPEKVNPA